MKVFVVEGYKCIEHEECVEVLGVFSTEEKALACVHEFQTTDKNAYDAVITECEVE